MKLSNFAKAFYTTFAIAITVYFTWWFINGIVITLDSSIIGLWVAIPAFFLAALGARIATSDDTFAETFVPSAYETIALCAVIGLILIVANRGDDATRLASLIFLFVLVIVQYKLNSETKPRDDRPLDEILDEFVKGD